MRPYPSMVFSLFLLFGCSDSHELGPTESEPSLGTDDAGRSMFVRPPASNVSALVLPEPDAASAAAPQPGSPLPGLVVVARGEDFRDASADQGGNLWAVTASKVHFFRAGDGAHFTYDQANGLT